MAEAPQFSPWYHQEALGKNPTPLLGTQESCCQPDQCSDSTKHGCLCSQELAAPHHLADPGTQDAAAAPRLNHLLTGWVGSAALESSVLWPHLARGSLCGMTLKPFGGHMF